MLGYSAAEYREDRAGTEYYKARSAAASPAGHPSWPGDLHLMLDPNLPAYKDFQYFCDKHKPDVVRTLASLLLFNAITTVLEDQEKELTRLHLLRPGADGMVPWDGLVEQLLEARRRVRGPELIFDRRDVKKAIVHAAALYNAQNVPDNPDRTSPPEKSPEWKSLLRWLAERAENHFGSAGSPSRVLSRRKKVISG